MSIRPPLTSSDKPSDSRLTPVCISRDQHNVSRKDISPGCLNVLYKLNEEGFDAFIVGGGVRDLLLSLHPKDFDVTTNATPEEVRDIFRSSRIIGRRFRIVHVRMGREIIEVSTFRAAPQESLQVDGESLSRKVNHIDSARSASGMLLRDNVYGDIDGDAIRRDFTVNALYYTVRNFEIHDFVNGMQDIQDRVLRMIGDPATRYREDPVRTLRAIRLSVKLGFSIEPATAAPIKESAALLESIPPARLFDECLKLFFSGHALNTWQALYDYGVFAILFADSAQHIENNEMTARFIKAALVNTDKRLAEGQNVAPYFLFAVFLWPAVEARFKELCKLEVPEIPAMGQAAEEVIRRQLDRLSIPRRFSMPMREVWEMQLRLPRRKGKKAATLLNNRRFRAAYDFLLLREESGLDTDGLGLWWTQFQQSDSQEKNELIHKLDASGPRSKSRKRKAKPSDRRPRNNSPQQ